MNTVKTTLDLEAPDTSSAVMLAFAATKELSVATPVLPFAGMNTDAPEISERVPVSEIICNLNVDRAAVAEEVTDIAVIWHW